MKKIEERYSFQFPVNVKVSRNRKFPIKSFGVILTTMVALLLLVTVMVATTFSTTFIVGKTTQSIETKTVINLNAPVIGDRQANVVFEVMKVNVTTSTVPTTSSTTTTTLWFDYSDNNGVSYRFMRDKQWLGKCFNGGLGR